MGKSGFGGLMALGLLLVVLGLAGFAVPYFTTEHKEDVAKVGSLHLQTTESTPHVVPPALAGGALLAGLVLIGFGVSRRA
jgi:hypothetical protein